MANAQLRSRCIPVSRIGHDVEDDRAPLVPRCNDHIENHVLGVAGGFGPRGVQEI